MLSKEQKADRRDYRRSLIWKLEGIDIKLERVRKGDRKGFVNLSAVNSLTGSGRLLAQKLAAVEAQIGKKAA